MTHGDKTKAKGKTSLQASGKKSSSKAGDNGKGSGEAAGSEKAGTSKAGADSKGAKESATAGDVKGKTRSAAAEGGGFSNPVIADAFKHALKKYPNAFRKLTD
jgi:hypothetical protein